MRKLGDIERDANAATPGPLCTQTPEGWPSAAPPSRTQVVDEAGDQVADCYDNRRVSEAQAIADATFFANARTDVPDLVAEVRRLMAAGDQVLVPAALLRSLRDAVDGTIDTPARVGSLVGRLNEMLAEHDLAIAFVAEHPPERPHLVDGMFQSDKYPTTPRGKVPLSCRDAMAQDLLWEYAQRRRRVDVEFAADLETALKNQGFEGKPLLVLAMTPEEMAGLLDAIEIIRIGQMLAEQSREPDVTGRRARSVASTMKLRDALAKLGGN